MTVDGSVQVVRTAGALLIGGELLSGKVRDENLFRLTQTLRALGISLERVAVLPDAEEPIAREVRAQCREFDVVFSSGGVGPTHDDVTVAGVARGLGKPVVEDPTLIELLKTVYGESFTEDHKLMARVPQGSRLVHSRQVRWPTVVADKVWILPGVPELFRMKLALVRECMRGPEPFVTAELLTIRDELSLKPDLDEVVANHPDVEVGSYPKWFDERYKTRVTFDGRSADAVDAARTELAGRIGRPELVDFE